MRLQLRSFTLALALAGGSFSCSEKAQPAPRKNAAALPDLAQAETWDRKNLGLQTRGRATIVATLSPRGAREAKCTPSASCLCLEPRDLAVHGPRTSDEVLLVPPLQEGNGQNYYPCDVCTGECPFPLGEAELEGVLSAKTFRPTSSLQYLGAPPQH